jgi:hypothetical protein
MVYFAIGGLLAGILGRVYRDQYRIDISTILLVASLFLHKFILPNQVIIGALSHNESTMSNIISFVAVMAMCSPITCVFFIPVIIYFARISNFAWILLILECIANIIHNVNYGYSEWCRCYYIDTITDFMNHHFGTILNGSHLGTTTYKSTIEGSYWMSSSQWTQVTLYFLPAFMSILLGGLFSSIISQFTVVLLRGYLYLIVSRLVVIAGGLMFAIGQLSNIYIKLFSRNGLSFAFMYLHIPKVDQDQFGPMLVHFTATTLVIVIMEKISSVIPVSFILYPIALTLMDEIISYTIKQKLQWPNLKCRQYFYKRIKYSDYGPTSTSFNFSYWKNLLSYIGVHYLSMQINNVVNLTLVERGFTCLLEKLPMLWNTTLFIPSLGVLAASYYFTYVK